MPSYVATWPVGPFRLHGNGSVLTRIEILDWHVPDQVDASDALLIEAAAQLQAYFSGTLRTFDLPLAEPATPANARLRNAILSVGHGSTASYGALAKVAGSSARAVGQACRRNPFPVLVPCHRVLDAAGTVGNYSAGGGAATKQWLLDHERR